MLRERTKQYCASADNCLSVAVSMTEHKAALAVELECKGDAKGDAKSEASSSKRGLSLSKDQIVELFEQRVTRVQKQFQLGFTLTVRLLEHFKFDAERLIAAVDPKHPQDVRYTRGSNAFSRRSTCSFAAWWRGCKSFRRRSPLSPRRRTSARCATRSWRGQTSSGPTAATRTARAACSYVVHCLVPG